MKANPATRAVWLAAVFGGLLVCAVYSPGLMSGDSLDQLSQARTGRFSDWHPPLMAWVWARLEFFVRGPLGMLVLQAAAFWAGLALIGRDVASRRLAPVMVLTIGFWPPILGMEGTIWKDVQMASALTLAVGLLLSATVSKGNAASWALIALAYAVCLRHNAILAAAPLGVWAGWLIAGRWGLVSPRARALAAGGLLAGLALAPATVNRALVQEEVMPVQQLFVFDLAGISVRANEFLLPAAALPPGYTRQDLARGYSELDVGPLYWGEGKHILRAGDRAVVATLGRAWRAAIKSHPRAYLAHRFALFRDQLGLRPDVIYPYHSGIDPNTLGIARDPSTLSQSVARALEAVRNWPIFRPWLYLGALALCLVSVIRPAMRGERWAILAGALAISGAAYMGGYFFIGMGPDLRFNLWGIVAAWLACAFWGRHLGESRRNSAERLDTTASQAVREGVQR